MSRKIRLDLHLLTKGLAGSRQQAQKLIRAGKVRKLTGELLDKPGTEVSIDLELQVQSPAPFVSRGGEKLEGAFKAFSLQVEGRVCLDGGISTGGFTDCLLQHGASYVYGIDVGYGQTAWGLRNDPRVVLKERTNIRKLTCDKLYRPQDPIPNFAVADLSFISLRLVIPAITDLLDKERAEAVFLVKPQFEVGRERVGKRGVVRDPAAHIDALKAVIDSAIDQKWKPQGLIGSPLKGAAGNHEYLLWLGVEEVSDFPLIRDVVMQTLD